VQYSHIYKKWLKEAFVAHMFVLNLYPTSETVSVLHMIYTIVLAINS
jgi:hypothetical protein